LPDWHAASAGHILKRNSPEGLHLFERFTESARKAVFFARYEAIQSGCAQIESEHLLLGILRPDAPLTVRLLGSTAKVELIRDQIGKQAPERTRASTPHSQDFPLSQECKRVLAYGAEEAEKLRSPRIELEHVLLGFSRESNCFATKVMQDYGLTRQKLQEEAERLSEAAPRTSEAVSPIEKAAHDLTQDAREGKLEPLIGRDREVERALHILSRRTKNNPVLIGPSGVGKTAIVAGLAQRFADGAVPPALADRPILAIDATQLIAPRGPSGKPFQLASPGQAILCVEGLFDLAGTGSGWGVTEAIRILEPHLSHGVFQCIATGTPDGLLKTLEKAEGLSRHFEVIRVSPSGEDEALRIVSGAKEHLERFHGVNFGEGTIQVAIAASLRFLVGRQLPDRVIDLLDEAGARVKMLRETEPAELIAVRQRIRRITREMESAIANHKFETARQWAEEEKSERQSLSRLREEFARQPPHGNTVTPNDILEVVAERAGTPVASIRQVIERDADGDWERTVKTLAGGISTVGHEWLACLASYLVDCSGEEAEKLAQAILAVKNPGKL
jgi:ATP-dependent Clp protease ATP-binding subunit ClpC